MTDAERIARMEAQAAEIRQLWAKRDAAMSAAIAELREAVAILVSKARHTR